MKKKTKILLLMFILSVGFLVIFAITKSRDELTINRELVEVQIYFDNDYKSLDCNIILISIDTLRADHLGCYGYFRNTTPNIDKFARESILFENAYSQAPATMPALRSIMTGRVISNESKDDIVSYCENSTYLAEILSKRGYLTVGFTDHYALGSENDGGSFNKYHAHTLLRGLDSFQNFGKNAREATSHVLTENVVNWLDQNYKNKFFLWIHYFDPHFNYNPLPEYEALFGFSEEDCGRIYNGIDIEEIREIEKSLSKKEVESLISLYDAEIFYTDKHIALLLDKIKELGLSDNTVIILTADHGEEFKERTRIGHERTVYNELIHVPLMIKMPNQTPAKIKTNIATKEIFEILSNLSSNKTIEVYGGDIISRTYHYYKGGKTESNDFTIVSGNYKYIYNPETGKEEFYNLHEDIGEKNNLISKSAHKDKKRELRQKLMSWIDKNNVETQKPSKEALESQEKLDKRLRSLGYLR